MALVYLARNTVNGKIYVGVTTKTLKQRVHSHFWLASKDGAPHTLFSKAIRKHGRGRRFVFAEGVR